MAFYREEFKGVEYTIRTFEVGKRWGWELTVGKKSLDSGTGSIEPEAAAYVEARGRARSVIKGE